MSKSLCRNDDKETATNLSNLQLFQSIIVRLSGLDWQWESTKKSGIFFLRWLFCIQIFIPGFQLFLLIANVLAWHALGQKNRAETRHLTWWRSTKKKDYFLNGKSKTRDSGNTLWPGISQMQKRGRLKSNTVGSSTLFSLRTRSS